MTRFLAMIAAVCAAVACSAAARPETPHAAPAYAPHVAADVRAAIAPVTCEVRVTPTGRGVQLQARAHATRATAGAYELVITKGGPGGSSDISQGGEFDLADGASLVLGSSEIGMEPRATWRARLVLRDARGEICRHEARS